MSFKVKRLSRWCAKSIYPELGDIWCSLCKQWSFQTAEQHEASHDHQEKLWTELGRGTNEA